ncbi:MAG TPA: oligogalacturonate lyase family protein [Opitutaceae bacterium]|nr:oligogalacturonate lyase family protein [Opitutaceae bacterium]
MRLKKFRRVRTLCAFAFALAASLRAADAPQPEPPTSWIDPDTGHRVLRVTSEPGSVSLYFNDNSFTPDGKSMVYTAGGGIAVLDLATFKTRSLVPAPARVIVVGHRTPSVYFTRSAADRSTSALFAADIATGAIRKIADLPRRASVATINADETLAAGTFEEATVESTAPRAAAPMATVSQQEAAKRGQVLDAAVSKVMMMDARLAERRPMTMFTLDLRTGATKNILEHSTDWLNHLQFSPSDPTLLMYCHEGTWWKVDRIWTIRTDGTQNTLIHKRTMGLEAAGHEFWSPDGKTIWYEIRFPWGVDHFTGGYNVETGERTWYHVDINAWSIHYSQSVDGKLFCGDGGSGTVVEWASPENEWIYLFRPELLNASGSLGENLIRPGVFHPERLVNLHRNKYTLEPNAFFTPDQKHVIFRSNMFGPTYVFAVEVAKAP